LTNTSKIHKAFFLIVFKLIVESKMDLFSEIVQLQSEYEQTSQKLQSTKKQILNLSMKMKESISNSQMLSDAIERSSIEIISLKTMLSNQISIFSVLNSNFNKIDEQTKKISNESQSILIQYKSIR